MTRHPVLVALALAASLALIACGGDKGQKTSGSTNPADDLDTPGEGTGDPAGNGDGDGDGDGTAAGDGDGSATGDGDGDGSAAGDGDGDGSGSGSAAPVPTGPPVTFELRNTHDDDLVFNLDGPGGWVRAIFVYSGKPPKAVPVLPFPNSCKASCGAAAADRCPVCKIPTSLGQKRKAEKAARVTIAADKTLDVPWDAEVHTYKKTKANRRSCKCFDKAAVAEGTYTVKICGLRLSKKHKRKSKLQCIEKIDALTFPSDAPQKLTFDFGDPTPPKKKK